MFKNLIKQKKEEIEEFLKNSDEHNDKKIDYILYKPDTKETNTLASNSFSGEAIEFTPKTKDSPEGYFNVPEWDYNFDYYIYNLLEENWKIGYMTPEVHYSIWNSIHELYPEDISYKDGVQNYLQYCADNGITKEYIDKNTKFDTPDIMKHFEGLAMFEIMEYKGYIIEADDVNFDNDKENLVNIYETKRDYENKECIETISLNTIGLKQNIREYIDETYVIDVENIADTFVNKEIKELKVKLVGIDNWDRPVYKDKKGTFYKDINLGTGSLALYTSSGNKFEGEPDYPLSNNTKINIVKSFKKIMN